MGRALALAFQQLPDPAFRRTLWRGLGLSLVVFAVLAGLAAFGLRYVPAFRWDWVNDLIVVTGVFGYLALVWLLFPAISSAFIGLLLDDVADAVERRHYSEDPPGKAPSLGVSMVLSLKLMAVLVVLNILALPVYVIGLVVPFLSLGVFLVLNGYLLSREYFELVATRHMSARDAKLLRKYWRGRVFLAGLVLAGLFALPGINLLAPILGAAFMMHIYKALPGVSAR
jgi:CysZ protein